jgi:hypothetical protein
MQKESSENIHPDVPSFSNQSGEQTHKNLRHGFSMITF